jgi:predicted transcriptional regulator
MHSTDRFAISMKHRTTTAIVAEILRLASHSMSKSRIMYKAFLSHHQLNTYLYMLTERGMIASGGNNTYRTTEKGFRFLELYEQLEGLVPSLLQKYEAS